jgi:hypothetical protein
MSERLPNIRVISVPVANVILLQSVGAGLVTHFGDPSQYPVTRELAILVEKLTRYDRPRWA